MTVGIGPNGRDDFTVGFIPSAMVCGTINPSVPTIRKGSGVRIVTDGATINYGQNTIFNASGDATSPVPTGYPFPGQRKYSLIYRVGTVPVQGESGPVVFIADQTAQLEVCVNDNPGFLADNTGGMKLTISVNERSAQ
jgi:hypothetical protein